mgnify:FL=1
MKKTAQFGLNQWEMSDRIQMDDFNADNAAIEAALARVERRSAFHTILDVTTTEDLKNAAWPLNIDWTEWKSVTIEIMPAEGSQTMVLGYSDSASSAIRYLEPSWNVMLGFPGGFPDAVLSLVCMNGAGALQGCAPGSKTCYRHFTHIGLFSRSGYADSILKAGSRILVRGEKL